MEWWLWAVLALGVSPFFLGGWLLFAYLKAKVQSYGREAGRSCYRDARRARRNGAARKPWRVTPEEDPRDAG